MFEWPHLALPLALVLAERGVFVPVEMDPNQGHDNAAGDASERADRGNNDGRPGR